MSLTDAMSAFFGGSIAAKHDSSKYAKKPKQYVEPKPKYKRKPVPKVDPKPLYPNGIKACARCKQRMSIDCFALRTNAKKQQERSSYCGDCTKIIGVEYRKANADKIKQAIGNWYQEHKVQQREKRRLHHEKIMSDPIKKAAMNDKKRASAQRRRALKKAERLASKEKAE